MFKLKDKNNYEFFGICLKLGIGVIVYRLSLELLSTVFVTIAQMLILVMENEAAILLVNYGVQSMVSVLSFAISALVTLILLNTGKRKNFKGIFLGLKAPLLAPFLIISTVAINFAASEINGSIINLISSNAVTAVSDIAYAEVSVLELVLLIISTAVIPGIVEELMFRGIILTNLAPYGKGMAIVTSALLFGLMHCNPAQFFYTTAMGVILGIVYVKTHSIWVCMAAHFLNNFIAVIEQYIYGNFEGAKAESYASMLRGAVIVIGAASIVILLLIGLRKKKKTPEENGSFGRIFEPSLSYEARQVSRRGKMIMFFNPTMSAFTAIIFGTMFTTAASLILVGFLIGLFPDMVNEIFTLV